VSNSSSAYKFAHCFQHRVIDAYTRESPTENLKHSFKTFELMEAQMRAGVVIPNERVYTSFMRAMTRGLTSGLHQKASFLLTRMVKLYDEGNEEIKPTVFTYNAVLNACAESVHIEDAPLGEAFKTAVKVFTELRNSDQKPDQVTFGNMLRCSRLLPAGEQKEMFISATFRLCCEQGFVNGLVVRDLQESASEELQQSLLGGQSQEVDMNSLPREWKRMIEVKRGGSSDGEFPQGRGGRGGGRGRGGRGGGRGRAGRGRGMRGGSQDRARF
jgi:hypothetical protein